MTQVKQMPIGIGTRMTRILRIDTDFFICNYPLNLHLLDHNHAGDANTFGGGVRARLIAPLHGDAQHGANTRPANTFVGAGAGRATPLHRRNQYDANHRRRQSHKSPKSF
ncbi:MAG: hypothetical protein LBD59_00040 [Prevotellaceae bacterium]|nr:hypothetical protein [Prevotellaceae bacterium]